MTYLRPHNRAGRGRRNSFVLLAFIVLAIAAVQILAPHIFPGLFHTIALPFWRAEFAVVNGVLQSEQALLSENEKLRRRIADYEIMYASSTTQLLQTQNAALLSMFGRASSTPENYTVAAVLSRPSFVPYDELIIDVGSEHGISASSLVYSPGQVLIGEIVRVLPKTSIVSLYSSPNESFSVYIGPDLIPAIAIGQGGGQYRAEVPHGTSIVGGDVVVDSVLQSKPFGVVIGVSTDPANPFDTVLIAPPVNIFDVAFVLVR